MVIDSKGKLIRNNLTRKVILDVFYRETRDSDQKIFDVFKDSVEFSSKYLEF